MSRTARWSAFSSSSESACRSSGASTSWRWTTVSSSSCCGYPITTLSMNRSICASGSGYVPSDSIGFWVAMTRNGSGTGCVVVPDRHLPLLHHLEQRGLDLRGSAVDLVREEEVAEDGPELGVERAVARAVDPRPDEVRRNEVGRELHARERPAEHAGRRLDRQRLREARDALDQEMALRQQADEHPLEHRVLPCDDPPDLEQRLLELLLRFLRGRTGLGRFCSVIRGPFSRLGAIYESTRG